MDLNEAAENFRRATRHCDNLIEVHRGYGGPAPGHRDEEVSINRAVVVLAVASWQALIQDFALASVDLSAPGPGSPLSRATYAVLAGRARKEVGDFATPNAENVRRLLIGAGFDPRAHWTWSQRGGQGRGMVTWSPTDAETRINEWLRVRHAIAHVTPSCHPSRRCRRFGCDETRQPTRISASWMPSSASSSSGDSRD